MDEIPKHPEPMSCREIAKELGVTERQVHRILEAALSKLRSRISREEFAELISQLHPREDHLGSARASGSGQVQNTPYSE